MKSGTLSSILTGTVANALTQTTQITSGTIGSVVFAILVAMLDTAKAMFIRRGEDGDGNTQFSVYFDVNSQFGDARGYLQERYDESSPGEHDRIQRFVPTGDTDGRIIQWTVADRVFTAPNGGKVDGIQEAIDLQPARKMNVGNLVDRIFDMEESKGVFLQPDPTLNASGTVWALSEIGAAAFEAELDEPVLGFKLTLADANTGPASENPANWK